MTDRLRIVYSAKALRIIPGWILGEAFLGFLAILSAALTILPWLFQLKPYTITVVDAAQWTIIALFALEYGAGFASATSKRDYLLNPWRIIDGATIAVPLITLAPGVSQLFRSSPALRLLRLIRLITLGMRASAVVIREEQAQRASKPAQPVEVQVISANSTNSAKPATWDEFVHWIRKPGAGWYSVANAAEDHIAEVSAATGLGRDYILAHLNGYPHAETNGKFLSLFAWLPEAGPDGSVFRTALLLLATEQRVITFSGKQNALFEKVRGSLPADTTTESFPADLTCSIFSHILRTNESIIVSLERQLAALEELPVRESHPKFFEQTFHLKKELSAAQADLWRLRSLLKDLAEARVKLPGHKNGHLLLLRDLGETAEYLYETANNVREGVLSLIDLHLNVVSFEMNRVMRLLAVVSILGLIPAVVGGLFGMNLVDNPWHFTLPQVTFAVCLTMISSLYFFIVKGWLR